MDKLDNGKKSFLGLSWHSTWLAQSSQDIHKLYKTSTVENTAVNSNRLAQASQEVKTAFWILSDTQTDMNKLHKTSTVAKTAFLIFPDIHTGLHELHKTYRVVKNAFKVPTDTETGMHECYRTSSCENTSQGLYRCFLAPKLPCPCFTRLPQ